MVGVAGRSKACATCKARHIKCDEGRPACNRCNKAGYECQGYGQPTMFVDETTWIQRKHNPKRAVSETTVDKLVHGSSWNPIELHRKLSPEVLGFLRGLFVASHGVDFSSWHYCGQSQGSMVRRLSIPGVTLRAVALGLYGRIHRHTVSLDQAAEIYGFALRQIRFDLMSPALSLSLQSSLVTSVLNLSMYEWIVGTDRSAWRHHVRALARLIEMQGPGAFCQGPAKRAFLQARSVIVVLAFEDRQKTFLGDELWQTMAWINIPEAKSYTNRFADILCCIPEIIQDVDKFRALKDQKRCDLFHTSIREKIIALKERLFDIRCDWEIARPNVVHEVRMDASERRCLTVDEDGNQMFDTLLYYDSLQDGVEMGIYHTCVLLLKDYALELGFDEVFTRVPAISPKKTNPSLRFPHEVSSLLEIGHDILRSAEFYLQPQHGLTGPYFLMFPLAVAQSLFDGPRHHREARWIRKIMKHIADNHGFSIAYEYC